MHSNESCSQVCFAELHRQGRDAEGEDTGSMENLFEIRRYQIDIDNEQVANLSQYILETFPSTNDFWVKVWDILPFRPFSRPGRTTQQRRSPITTNLTSQKSTPTTMEGIQLSRMQKII